MTDTLNPRDDKDVEEAVRWALAESKSLEIVGHGSKRAIGRPAQTDLTLDLSALSGVTLYEPEELVLTAKAGTPIAEIEALVASQNQQLAFEPMDYGPLLGGPAGRGTIGGVLAANVSGPRRIKAGAARDHFLGLTAVSGRGETFKSGGRVVKNVTGYDLCKLMAGSWGTLAVSTEVTIKTLPRPETEATVAGARPRRRGGHPCDGRGHGLVVRRLRRGPPAGRGGGAHPDRGGGRRRPCADGAAAGGRAAVGRAPPGGADGHREGLRRSRRPGRDRLTRPLARHPRRDAVCGEPRWGGAAGVAHLDGADAGARSSRAWSASANSEFLFDWAGGLVWVMLPNAGDDAGATSIRRAVAAVAAGTRRSFGHRRRCAPRLMRSSRRTRALSH